MKKTLKEPKFLLSHNLNHLFDDIKAIKTVDEYENSALYKEHGAEINRVVDGVEWDNTLRESKPKDTIRVVSWNIERGAHLKGVIEYRKSNEILSRADIILLTETDIGMGRSGNHNVPKEIATALKMNYCYANSYIVFSKGDIGEQEHDLENTLSLHGTTIVSKYPIQSCRVEPLPTFRDAFYSPEKRLGKRRVLICTIEIGNKLYDFAALHIDHRTSFIQRAEQMQAALLALDESDGVAKLIGGDLNTSTYNLKSKLGLARNLLYKAIVMGFNKAVGHYMTPEKFFEKPLFEVLNKSGYDYKKYNDVTTGTMYFDVNDLLTVKKSTQMIPNFVLRWMRRKLRPWNGEIPLRNDWLAGKGFDVVYSNNGVYGPPQIIEKPVWDNRQISDHNPLIVDLKL